MLRIAVALVVVAGLGDVAVADKDGRGFLMLAGLNVNRTFHDEADNGFTLGAEISAAWLDAKNETRARRYFPELEGIWWGGGYLDLLRDFGTDTTRLSIGPELGYTVVGVDGGLVVEFGDDTRTGFVIRPVLTVAVVTLYYRYGHFFDDRPDNRFHEAGMLLKWALPFWKDI